MVVKLLLLVRVTYHQHFYVIAGYISTFVSRLEIRTAKMDGFEKTRQEEDELLVKCDFT